MDNREYWVGVIYKDLTWYLVINEEDAGHFDDKMCDVFKDMLTKKCNLGIKIILDPEYIECP